MMRHAAGMAAFWAFATASAAGEPPARIVSHISGEPVPRYESLRYAAVHGRSGPSLDHPIVWRYERKGLPMLIVKESPGWRRVRDPDGAEVWVLARMLGAERTVMTRGSVVLRRKPDEGARGICILAEGVVAEIIAEADGWLRLSVAGRKGWIQRSGLWGLNPDETGL